MFYILGVITGLVIAILIVILLKRYETAITRTVQQTQSKLKPKGSIIDPVSEDLEDWIKDLKKI